MKKHEREIRELLEKMDNFLPDNPPDRAEREPKKKIVGVMPPAPKPIPIRKNSPTRFKAWLQDHKISSGLACIIIGFGVVIAGLIVLQNFSGLPGMRITGQILVAAGAIIYLIPVFMRFFTGQDLSNGEGPKYWRSQSVDDSGFSWQSVTRWFQSRKRRPVKDSWSDRKGKNRW